MKEAMFYDKMDNDVNCRLCPNACIIKEGQRGACSVRLNIGGILYTTNYEVATSLNIDPIEKKPLFHFYPGSSILSIGSFGCNFKCDFCQNFAISQNSGIGSEVTVEELVSTTVNDSNTIGIAFTYNEPTVWFEYMYEVSKKIKEIRSKKVVLVTNGYIEPEPLALITPYVDAFNIDIKGNTEEFYKNICKGKLEPVKRNIEYLISQKKHVEITNLMITDINDKREDVSGIAEFISKLNPEIPLHLSRYFPNYKRDEEPTPISRIIDGKKIAKEYLEHVYIGNIIGIDNSTFCKKCGEMLINRKNYETTILVDSNICPVCNTKNNIIL